MISQTGPACGPWLAIAPWTRWLLSLLLAALAPAAAHSQAAPPASIDDFFKPPEITQVSLSPSGRYLAGLRAHNGRLNLSVVDLDTRKALIITNYDAADVFDYRWISDERLVYRLWDRQAGGGEQHGTGLFAINRDGSIHRTLVRRDFVSDGSDGRAFPPTAALFGLLKTTETDDVLIVQFNEVDNRLETNLYRVNTKSGRSVPLSAGAPPDVIDWAVDWNGVARAAFALRDGQGTVYYRDSAEAPWRALKTFDAFKGEGFDPIAFGPDGTFYVSAAKRDKSALYRLDTAKGALEPAPLFSHRDYDVQPRLIYDLKRRRLLGVRYEADAPATYWYDKDWRAMQETVDASLPGRVNDVSRTGYGEHARVLVTSFSDTEPARYYLFDPRQKKLEMVGASRKWIDPARMARTRVTNYRARDGLRIAAQVSVPPGTDGKNLPLVVLVHGGPYVRGLHWGWNPEVQFLASRGYAVLEMDYRGSRGYGFKHFRAGWKQWGLAMQDDVADGVRWLVKEGVADPKRVCIAGASYGGYAVVMGLIRDPDLYQCGVSWVGVTDIGLLYTVGWSDMAKGDWQRYGMPQLVGDPVKDAAQLRETSAIENAARLKRPLILAYGLDDVRVPYEHGARLRDALKPTNRDVEYIEYGGEAHGWLKLETNRDFWGRVEKLLARTIGPGAKPLAAK